MLKVAREYGLAGELKIHDLRKTARSHWSRLGIHDRVAEALLNHAEANVLIATYDKRDLLAEKIEAMTSWCGAIEAALDDRDKVAESPATVASVVPLRKRQKAAARRPSARVGAAS